MLKRLLVSVFAVAVAAYACGDDDKDNNGGADAGRPDGQVQIIPRPDGGLTLLDAGGGGADAQAGLPDAAAGGPDAQVAGPDAGATGPYGTLTTISFTSAFVFDATKLSDNAYLNAHTNGLQTTDAFTGTYKTPAAPIPPTGAAQTLTLAARQPPAGQDPAFIFVQQQSATAQGAALDPIIQLQFFSDTIALGANTLGLTQSDSGALLVISPATQCIAAIGVGAVNVITATNTTAVEGGSLAFTGTNITLYHPTDTPYGDITALVAQLGATVCPR